MQTAKLTLLTALLALTFTAPATAGENAVALRKGTKSFQVVGNKTPGPLQGIKPGDVVAKADVSQEPTAANVADIAPAAGIEAGADNTAQGGAAKPIFNHSLPRK